jgi:hypothetical protein
MPTDRKARIDRWDAELTEEQRWQAYDRFRRFPWSDVRDWVAAEFHVPQPSRSALYEWARDMRERESEHRITEALSVKANVQRQMAAVGDMDGELQFSWEQLAMESSMRGDHEAGVRYLAMAMKLRESALEREKLRLKQDAEQRAQAKLDLDREKFETAERRLEATRAAVKQLDQAGGLTPEGRAIIEKAMAIL